ncbi:hypothetical protein KAS41_04575 [Candidatus Parcubacteria bacterium]|nr:hypothetical protein [Candidatus Parcubacteria bacterium]
MVIIPSCVNNEIASSFRSAIAPLHSSQRQTIKLNYKSGDCAPLFC